MILLVERMPTLVINAPKYQAEKNLKRSFSKTISTGIGDDYALNKKILSGLKRAKSSGTVITVIVLDKSTRKKATGILDKIVATGNVTGNFVFRFNIYISKLKTCPHYKSESLNRNGVALI